MSDIKSLFMTPLYRAALSDHGKVNAAELKQSCFVVAQDDEAGQDWCEDNGFPGYTSYASLSDLPWRFPIFTDVVKALDAHVAAFARDLHFDLGDKALKLEDIWINILPEGGIHTGHIHPHSVISGTTYVSMPSDTSAIKFEDPRLPMMMASPGRDKDAPEGLRQFVYVKPKVGDVLLWESWLRHEVPMNNAEDERVSVSFNYSFAVICLFSSLFGGFFFAGQFVAPDVVGQAKIVRHRLCLAFGDLAAIIKKLLDKIFVGAWLDDVFHMGRLDLSMRIRCVEAILTAERGSGNRWALIAA